MFSIFENSDRSLAAILDLLAAEAEWQKEARRSQLLDSEMDSDFALRLFRVLNFPTPVLRQPARHSLSSISLKMVRVISLIKDQQKRKDLVTELKTLNKLTTALERCVHQSLFTRDKFLKLADLCSDFKISDLVKN